MSISFRCEDFLVVWEKFWHSNYLFEVELLQYFRKLSRAARKAFACRVLCRPGLHELDRQLQPSRWGCHSWELQDQPLIFWDDLVLIASSQQSLQHALDRFSAACDRAGMKINTENTEVLCLSSTQGSVAYAASERQYTAGGEVQAPAT